MYSERQTKEMRLTAERVRFWKNAAILKQTEGFPQLTYDQQRMVLLSLYVQDRHRRDLNAGARYQSHGTPYHASYRDSSRHIAKSYCHGAIRNLEAGLPIAIDSYPQFSFPDNFFDTQYFPITNEQDAIDLIESLGFPCVVFVNCLPVNRGIEYQSHTFLALGHADKDIITWEKWGLNVFYRLTTLTSQFNRHGREMYWGARPLRQPAQITSKD